VKFVFVENAYTEPESALCQLETEQDASPKTSLSDQREVVARGGIEPPTHGFSVVIYGVNRCTNGPPSLVEARQDSLSVLRFPRVLSSGWLLGQGKTENSSLLKVAPRKLRVERRVATDAS
jgi:hypothetical protein